MATPGRIVAALASGSQETTLALANINFDFSLVKLDAPASFQGVGNRLSRKRKVSAESGSSHVTARKLGALFEKILPHTPSLIECYGLRASEIAQFSENVERSGPTYGMFADQAGVDATSIWAAATSGSFAIAVHLLACMLARMFPGPEATSIWAELIEERKKELANEDLSRPCHITTVLAAQISISRDQLAEWDNSARSWLRAADEAKNTQQTQLLLIIKNINVPVNREQGNLYRSVISAWKRALELMDNLLCGAAQCITPYEGNGDLLLALASWHIYPDMDVLGNKKVSQKDPLVSSEAILTVGLECSPAQQDIGVYWSLPLGHYRFYGPPKVSRHSICTDAERLSFGQCAQVMLGSYLSGWDYEGYDNMEYARTVLRTYEYLAAYRIIIEVDQDHDETHCESSCSHLKPLEVAPNWLRYLAEAGKTLLDSREPDRAMYNRLIGVGIRRGKDFLQNQAPIFGLDSFHDFFAVLVGTEKKIQALRRLADRLDLSGYNAIIRYRNPNYNEDGSIKNPQYSSKVESLDNHVNLATNQLKPPSTNSDKHNDERGDTVDFLPSMDPLDPMGPIGPIESDDSFGMNHALNSRIKQDTRPKGFNTFPLFVDGEPDLGMNTLTLNGEAITVPDDFYSYASLIPQDRFSAKRSWEGTEVKYLIHKRWISMNKERDRSETHDGEEVLELEDLNISSSCDDEITTMGYQKIYIKIGDPRECALFGHGTRWQLQTTLDDIIWALNSRAFDPTKLSKFLSSGERTFQELDGKYVLKDQRLARRALATVFETYDQLSRATVALKVIEMPLLQQQWVTKWRFRPDEEYLYPQDDIRSLMDPNFFAKKKTVDSTESDDFLGLKPLKVTREETFALLTIFETGSLNPDPSTLSKVMAMSSGDSIFVATQLLADPLDSRDLKPSSICRIRGNIGKPGVVMLIPPPELQVKPRNSANWAVINHTRFDGELVDSLQGTSLHLSFTDYSRAMDTGVHGVRDAEIYFLEAYVQIFFKGNWIGDADIIAALESDQFHIFDPQFSSSFEMSSCAHDIKKIPNFRVTAIDNWDEFLDNPKGGTIVRAKENWLARLAAATLSVQRKDETIVIRASDSICWRCVKNHVERETSAGNFAFIC